MIVDEKGCEDGKEAEQRRPGSHDGEKKTDFVDETFLLPLWQHA